VTVEKTAAAKVFFETHYNELTSSELTPRSLRRRQLEVALYYDTIFSNSEKEERRKAWAEDETNHLRDTRVMKARAGQIRERSASKYEIVKVLGKGSFGVVRLVREKMDQKYVLLLF
jgi:protein-serine/threonine kinase